MQEVEDPDWDPRDPGNPSNPSNPSNIELIRPEDFLPTNPFPSEAQRMGIDRWSDDAGMLAIAANLDPAKLSHKIVAWLMLLAVLVPLVVNLLSELT